MNLNEHNFTISQLYNFTIIQLIVKVIKILFNYLILSYMKRHVYSSKGEIF